MALIPGVPAREEQSKYRQQRDHSNEEAQRTPAGMLPDEQQDSSQGENRKDDHSNLVMWDDESIECIADDARGRQQGASLPLAAP